MKRIAPTAEDRAFRNELMVVLQKNIGNRDGLYLLAILAHTLGQLVALQDQRKVTREMALEVIMTNIEAGNQEVVNSLNEAKGEA